MATDLSNAKREISTLTCVLPGRSKAVERIVDHRDANTVLFPAIRINLAWYSATEEQSFENQSTNYKDEFIEFF